MSLLEDAPDGVHLCCCLWGTPRSLHSCHIWRTQIIANNYFQCIFRLKFFNGKIFLSTFSLVLIIIHLGLNSPCGRGKQLKYWLLLFSFLRIWMVASVSQLFLTVIQWWNKRMLQSLISADNVGSPASRAVNWSLFSCFSWRIWEHREEPRALAER